MATMTTPQNRVYVSIQLSDLGTGVYTEEGEYNKGLSRGRKLTRVCRKDMGYSTHRPFKVPQYLKRSDRLRVKIGF
jgi:hypothetical protein